MIQVSPPQDSPEHAAPSLTRRQRNAVLAMVSSTSYADAARRANVGLSTLKRWMKQTAFLDELDQLQGEALDIANAQIQGLMLRAVANLDEAMANSNPNIRLAATRMTLQYGYKLTQLNESRLQAQLAVSDLEDPDTEDPDLEAPGLDATANDSSPAQTPLSPFIPATELAFPVAKPAHSHNGAVAEWTEMDRFGPVFKGSAEMPQRNQPPESGTPVPVPPFIPRSRRACPGPVPDSARG